jgi:hypothetical protein
MMAVVECWLQTSLDDLKENTQNLFRSGSKGSTEGHAVDDKNIAMWHVPLSALTQLPFSAPLGRFIQSRQGVLFRSMIDFATPIALSPGVLPVEANTALGALVAAPSVSARQQAWTDRIQGRGFLGRCLEDGH